MKKIGDTDEGNIIVEMTPLEWDKFKDKETVAHAPPPLKGIDIVEYQEAFWAHLGEIGVSPRCRCTIARYAGISVGTGRKPRFGGATPGHILRPELPFKEWCYMVLSRQIKILDIRNFGKGMRSELEAAIRRYLDES